MYDISVCFLHENFCPSLKFDSKELNSRHNNGKLSKTGKILKGYNRHQGCISYVCERNAYFYVVVFLKSMSLVV